MGRHVHYLETHIIGDPTYHFANTEDPSLDMNKTIVIDQKKVSLWHKLLKYPNADVQCMCIAEIV